MHAREALPQDNGYKLGPAGAGGIDLSFHDRATNEMQLLESIPVTTRLVKVGPCVIADTDTPTVTYSRLNAYHAAWSLVLDYMASGLISGWWAGRWWQPDAAAEGAERGAAMDEDQREPL